MRNRLRSYIPYVNRLSFEGSTVHWKGGTQHRRSNPHVISFDLVSLHYGVNGKRASTFYGWRLWFYIRPNHALYVGFYYDRRKRNG